MKKTSRSIFFALLAILTTAPAFSSDEDQTEPGYSDDFKAAFAQLKRLEGTWDEAGDGRVIEYRLTGRGSALIEEFIGDPPMTSVYHLDGDDLRLTHYCNAGNQPRMKAAVYKNNILKFDFVDVTNLSAPNAYHTRTLDIVFHDDDHVDLKFVGLKDDREVPGTVSLTRRSTSAVVVDNTDEINAEAAFQLLKDGLVGEWKGIMVHNSAPVEATFYLTGNDLAIVEYIRQPEKPAASMSTVYHLAEEHLQLTHYCSYGNQPRLQATSVSPDGKTVRFEFLDVTNLSCSGNRYTHKMEVSFPDRQHASVKYIGIDDGVEGELTVELTRIE